MMKYLAPASLNVNPAGRSGSRTLGVSAMPFESETERGLDGGSGAK
jgi:hypothetical protein